MAELGLSTVGLYVPRMPVWFVQTSHHKSPKNFGAAVIDE